MYAGIGYNLRGEYFYSWNCLLEDYSYNVDQYQVDYPMLVNLLLLCAIYDEWTVE